MLHWDKLRVFHAVAKAGSFTHAGDALGLSQSAVSRQISALEEHLSVVLFHRHARGLVPTEQGEILFAATRAVEAHISESESLLLDSREKPRGRLRVTTTVGFGTAWLTPRLSDFTRLYPDIAVELLLTDTELDLANREADVAIRLHAPAQGDLIQRKLFCVHYHLYASGAYLERRGMPAGPQDLARHDIILYGANVPKPIAPVNWLGTLARGHGPLEDQGGTFSVNCILGIARAAEAGMGIAALPDYLCASNPRLVRLLPGLDGPTFDTHFVYAEELRHSKRVGVFRDFVLERTREWIY